VKKIIVAPSGKRYLLEEPKTASFVRLVYEGEETMANKLRKGDTVTWKTSQGETTGKVVKNQTTPTKIKGHEVKASKSDPQVIVESSKTGAEAAHKPSALKKKS